MGYAAIQDKLDNIKLQEKIDEVKLLKGEIERLNIKIKELEVEILTVSINPMKSKNIIR